MEVTTVSPSLASPTEGDDLCETDVTNVAIHSVTLLICFCGLVGNGAVLGLLSLKIRNADIFDLAFTDFLILLLAVPSTLLFLLEDVSCSPIMPLLYLSLLFPLTAVSVYWTLFRLMYTNNTAFMDKLCMLCCRYNIPLRLLWLVDSVQYWAYFALFTVIPALTYQCPSHQQGHCQAALITIYTIILILFPASMIISRTIVFIKAKWCSKKQQPQRRDILVFLFLLFVFPLSLCNFLHQLGFIAESYHVFFLLNCIQSSIKPFIYFLAGRCWSPCALSSLRLSLERVFDEQKKKKMAAAIIPPRSQGSEPGDPLRYSAEGPCESA